MEFLGFCLVLSSIGCVVFCDLWRKERQARAKLLHDLAEHAQVIVQNTNAVIGEAERWREMALLLNDDRNVWREAAIAHGYTGEELHARH